MIKENKKDVVSINKLLKKSRTIILKNIEESKQNKIIQLFQNDNFK